MPSGEIEAAITADSAASERGEIVRSMKRSRRSASIRERNLLRDAAAEKPWARVNENAIDCDVDPHRGHR